MGFISREGRKLNFAEIRAGHWEETDPYYRDSLLFCKAWLEGAANFSLQTSGSTGVPETIHVTREQMVASARATAVFFGINGSVNMLCCLNTQMIAGKMMLVRAMEWNSCLYLVKPSSNPFLDVDETHAMDFVALVPYQLEVSLADPKSRDLLHRVKHLIIGGAPLSPVLREKVRKLPGNVFQTYGMTETVSHIALADLKAPGALVYRTLPGVEIRLSADSCLVIKAPMSNKAWLSTRDIVKFVSPNGFVWKGRADFTINSGGVKVQPEAVEEIIAGMVAGYFPNKRFIVGSRQDLSLGEKVVLVVEQVSAPGSGIQALLSNMKTMLPPYHEPKEVLFLEAFAETGSGKINRRETLRKLSGAQSADTKRPDSGKDSA